VITNSYLIDQAAAPKIADIALKKWRLLAAVSLQAYKGEIGLGDFG